MCKVAPVINVSLLLKLMCKRKVLMKMFVARVKTTATLGTFVHYHQLS